MWIGVAIFLILTLLAGILAFGGIANVGAGLARVLFAVFLLLLLASAVAVGFADERTRNRTNDPGGLNPE